MEQKLYGAAMALPVTEMKITAIEDKVRPAKAVCVRPWVRLALAITAVLICVTTAFAFTKGSYGLWSGTHSHSYADVKLLNRKYDYIFPETLAGLSFTEMSTCYGAPQGTTHLQALLAPTYALHSVIYGSYEEEKLVSIGFGTTEKETWKYHFSVAEDGSCNAEEVEPGSQQIIEYGEYILHLYQIHESYSVRWEDAEKKMVIDVTYRGMDGQDEAIAVAKTLIDLNEN